MVPVPLATSLLLALLLGVFTDAIRADGSLGIVVALVACGVAAAGVSSATGGTRGVVLGIIGGASVIPLVLVIKLLRWPNAPVLGDGVPVLFTGYLLAAIAGAVAGRRLALRTKRRGR